MKKVSFCITYYNQKEFIKDSLSSVLAIDFPCDYEILVGDDGSSDGTVEVVNEYKNKYPDKIKLFIMNRDENSKSIGRASLNRLNLVYNATGDFIIFLDGDDFYCDKEFVKDSLKVFENNKKIIACAFDFKMLFEDNKEERKQLYLKTGLIPVGKYIKKFYNPAGAFVFKNVFKYNKDKVNFLRGIDGIFDDNGITLYFLQFGDLYYISRIIYSYRQNSNSLWNRYNLLEQNIVNLLYLVPMLYACPKYRFHIIKRYFSNIIFVWKNKTDITKIVSKYFYDNFCENAKKHNNYFLYSMLTWKKIKTIDKIKCFSKYFFYKIIERFI